MEETTKLPHFHSLTWSFKTRLRLSEAPHPLVPQVHLHPTRADSGSNLSSAKHKRVSTGAIVGGAVGGVVMLVAVVLFLLLLRRRRKRSGLDHDLNWRRLRT